MAASLQVRRKAGPRGSGRSEEPRDILIQEGPEVVTCAGGGGGGGCGAEGRTLSYWRGPVLEPPALTLTDPSCCSHLCSRHLNAQR